MNASNIPPSNSSDLIVVLALSFGLLVTSAIADIFIAYPLLAALALLIVALLRRGFAFSALMRMAWTGAKQAIPVVYILLLIGVLTAVWMAAGTVPALVYYGTQLISPRFFILWAFVLCSGLSVLIGTSFGTVGTIGVALMVIARGSDMAVGPVAGAIIAGAFVGDRCSPLSSSAHLVAAITRSDLYTNLRNMAISSVWPMLLSIVFYAAISLWQPLVPIANSSIAVELPKSFDLSLAALLPAVVVLVLAVLRVNVKLAMLASIGTGVAIAHALQQVPFFSIFKFSLLGYEQNNPLLQSVLIGGGFLPMAKATTAVFISTAFAGIFSGSRILSFTHRWLQHIRTCRQLSRATVAISFFSNLFGCTQTIGILLTEQLMRPHYERYYTNLAEAESQLALAIEDSATVNAPFIPWNIAGLIPATVLAVGPGFIPYLVYLLLLPVFLVLRGRSPIHSRKTSLEVELSSHENA